MKEVFGSYDSKNNSLFYKTNAIPVFYRIWFDNRKHIPKKNMIQIFKKIFSLNEGSWKNSINASGRVGCTIFYVNALANLNKLQKRYTFFDKKPVNLKKQKEKEEERKILSIFKK